MGGVLAIFAHPDDESLMAGGTLAACSAAGLDVRVVSMSRGEAGPSHGPGLAAGTALAAMRERELHDAARALGVHGAECLGYPDGQLDGIDWGDATAELAARIARWRPEAVITFGPEGFYWHPDHVAVHHLARVAAAVAPVAWVYEATWPLDRMAQLVDAMAQRGLATDVWGLDPVLFGVPAATITVTVDVRGFLDRKLRALNSHVSQFPPHHVLAAIPDDLARTFLGREYFVRSHPRSASVDWLTGVIASPALS